MAKLPGWLGRIISTGGAAVSSLCCLLPVAVILLGLGSGAFMATTMKYSAIFVPIGVLSVSGGFYLHFHERRQCAREGCRMAGGTWSIVLLTVSAVVVAAAVFFTLFPAISSDLLMWATAGHGGASHTMDMPARSNH